MSFQPDWPFEPCRAQVHTWELLAMQIVACVTLGASAYCLLDSSADRAAWATAIIHSLCVSLTVLLSDDARLGGAARFAPPGRLAVSVSGIVGGMVLFDIWFWGRARDAVIPAGATICVILAGVPLAGASGVRNLMLTREIRPFWSWLPLCAAVLQGRTLFMLGG